MYIKKLSSKYYDTELKIDFPVLTTNIPGTATKTAIYMRISANKISKNVFEKSIKTSYIYKDAKSALSSLKKNIGIDQTLLKEATEYVENLLIKVVAEKTATPVEKISKAIIQKLVFENVNELIKYIDMLKESPIDENDNNPAAPNPIQNNSTNAPGAMETPQKEMLEKATVVSPIDNEGKNHVVEEVPGVGEITTGPGVAATKTQDGIEKTTSENTTQNEVKTKSAKIISDSLANEIVDNLIKNFKNITTKPIEDLIDEKSKGLKPEILDEIWQYLSDYVYDEYEVDLEPNINISKLFDKKMEESGKSAFKLLSDYHKKIALDVKNFPEHLPDVVREKAIEGVEPATEKLQSLLTMYKNLEEHKEVVESALKIATENVVTKVKENGGYDDVVSQLETTAKAIAANLKETGVNVAACKDTLITVYEQVTTKSMKVTDAMKTAALLKAFGEAAEKVILNLEEEANKITTTSVNEILYIVKNNLDK